MRASYETIQSGLDQLFFSRLIDDETIEFRAEVIDTFLLANGWSWDQIIDEMEKKNGQD